MSDAKQLHADQIAYWNGPGADHWVSQQAHTDRQLSPITEAVLAAAAATPGERVLDIGCGCGTTTLLLGDAVGSGGQVTGLDVSEPMLACARQRGAGRKKVDWVLADAARHPLEPASFDLLLSRFGVMFFGEPTVAFAHLRRALRPGGRLVFVCWRAFEENSWMRVPLQAAYAHVPRLPRPGPEDPGPFSFADPDRLRRVLTGAGWSAPSVTPLDVELDIAAGGGLEQAVEQACQIGPAGRALREAPEEARSVAVAAIREALAPYLSGATVKLPAAAWLVASTAA